MNLSIKNATRARAAVWSAAAGVLAAMAAMAPAHAAASEVPFQSRLVLACSNNSCTGTTPIVSAGQRVTIRFVSCVFAAPQAAEYSFGDLSVMNPADEVTPLFQQFLVPQHRNGMGHWLVNQETETVIGANRLGRLRLATAGGNPTEAFCSLAGTRRIQN